MKGYMSGPDMSAYDPGADASENGNTSQLTPVEVQTEGQRTVPAPNESASYTDHGFAVGMQLGERYELRMRLGAGGMGTVFLARDIALASDVALKVLHHDVTGREDALRRLRCEVLLAQRISHPNICRTYDLEEFGGSYFVKMEYVLGEPLAERRRRQGRLAIAEVLRIARAVASGLAAAHAQGVIHCDLKPENILIEHHTGRVVLMDFGLARVEVRGRAAGEAEVSGTPAYMAPEQLTGGPVDARTDLYALGCVLYEFLVGDVPHSEATTFESATRCIQKPIPDPRQRRPEIPLWLSHVVQRLLAKEPEQRWRSTSELLGALVGPQQYSQRKTLIAAVVTIALIASVAWVAASRRASSWQPKIQARLPVYEENSGNAVVSPDGKNLAYVADREGGWQLYVEPLAGGLARRVSEGYFYPVQWTHDSQALLGVTPDFSVLRIAIEGGATETIARGATEAVDCDGRLILAIRGTGEDAGSMQLTMQERPGHPQQEILRFPKGTLVRDLRCDRSGRMLAYALIVWKPVPLIQSDIYVLDIHRREARRLTFDQQSNRVPIFAPDGKSIVFSSMRNGTSELWEMSIQGGEALFIPTGLSRVAFVTGLTRIRASDISPDGKLLLFLEDTPALPCWAYRIDTGERRRINRTLDFFTYPQPSPDDREVLVRVARQGKNYAAVLSVQTGEERILSEADAAAIMPDGREVLVAINDEKGAHIQAIPWAGGTPRHIGQLPKPVILMVLGGDSIYARLGTADNPQGVWKVPLAGGPATRENIPPDAVMVPAPIGGWRLVGTIKNHTMFHWHLVRPDQPLDAPAAKMFAAGQIAWAPDGKTFVSWAGRDIVRHVIATGEEQPLLRSELVEGGMALSHDGKTLFFAEWSGRVTRQMIVNFADRPRPGQ
jgi:Tol biopolymer transport system component